MLFQGGALLNSLTVADNVALPLRENGNVPESIIREIVRMKLELVDLSATRSTCFLPSCPGA